MEISENSVLWRGLLNDIKAIISISRGHITASSKRRSTNSGRTSLFLFYYDTKNRFKKRRINALQGLYYRRHISRSKTVKCGNCGRKFQAFFKRKMFQNSNIETFNCPVCGFTS